MGRGRNAEPGIGPTLADGHRNIRLGQRRHLGKPQVGGA